MKKAGDNTTHPYHALKDLESELHTKLLPSFVFITPNLQRKVSIISFCDPRVCDLFAKCLLNHFVACVGVCGDFQLGMHKNFKGVCKSEIDWIVDKIERLLELSALSLAY